MDGGGADWTKADYPAMKLVLEGINWQQEIEDKSGVECLEVFYDVLRRETGRYAFLRSWGERALGLCG